MRSRFTRIFVSAWWKEKFFWLFYDNVDEISIVHAKTHHNTSFSRTTKKEHIICLLSPCWCTIFELKNKNDKPNQGLKS